MYKRSLNKGIYRSNNRERKVRKIIKVLQEELKDNTLKECTVLDIGAGSGHIAYYLSSAVKHLTSVDMVDNRTIKKNYDFLVCKETLPFKDEQFDIIISNHVIEHVSNNVLFLSEINRVLKNDGIVYLATPNRLWPWEVHYKLFFLHYLPAKWFSKILKWSHRYHEDLNLLFWPSLKKLIKKDFHLTVYCDRIAREPNKYSMNVSNKIARKLTIFPLFFYTFATFINPTFVITLRKR